MSHFLHREAEAPRAIKLLNWNSDSGLSDPKVYVLFTAVHQIPQVHSVRAGWCIRSHLARYLAPHLIDADKGSSTYHTSCQNLLRAELSLELRSCTSAQSSSHCAMLPLYLIIMCVLLGFQHLIDSLCQILKTGLKIQTTK